MPDETVIGCGIQEGTNVVVPIAVDAAGHPVIQLDTLTNVAGDTAGLSAAGIFSISAQSRFRAYRDPVQNIPSNVPTLIIFQNETFDTQNEYDPATGLFTADEDGFYIFGAAVTMANMADGDRLDLYIQHNGITNYGFERKYIGVNGHPTISHTTLVSITAGDNVRVEFTQTNAAARNTGAGVHYTSFWGHKLS